MGINSDFYLLLEILGWFTCNLFIGLIVFATIDKNMVFHKWIKDDDPVFMIRLLIVTLWPILAVYMHIYYKRGGLNE